MQQSNTSFVAALFWPRGPSASASLPLTEAGTSCSFTVMISEKIFRYTKVYKIFTETERATLPS